MKKLNAFIAILLCTTMAIAQVEVGKDDTAKKQVETTNLELSDYLQFNGQMVSENPSENNFTLVINDSNIVLLTVPQGTLSFLIYEKEQVVNGDVHQLIFRLEKNKLTPETLDWTEFVITHVSKLTKDEKMSYTAGISSDCTYVLDIKGNPEIRLLGDILVGSIE